jgi:hypothetical protein
VNMWCLTRDTTGGFFERLEIAFSPSLCGCDPPRPVLAAGAAAAAAAAVVVAVDLCLLDRSLESTSTLVFGGALFAQLGS